MRTGGKYIIIINEQYLICAIRDSIAIRLTPYWSDIEKLDAQEGIGIGCPQWIYEGPWKYPAKTYHTLGGDVVRIPTFPAFGLLIAESVAG